MWQNVIMGTLKLSSSKIIYDVNVNLNTLNFLKIVFKNMQKIIL